MAILGEPSPQGRPTERGHETALDHFAADLRQASASELHLPDKSMRYRHLAGIDVPPWLQGVIGGDACQIHVIVFSEPGT